LALNVLMGSGGVMAETAPAAAVEISGLVKAFGSHRVLDGLDLRIPRGALVVLIGPSGCGKTTLLRCLNGLETFDAGRLTIAGVDVERPRHAGAELDGLVHSIRGRVGIVFQAFNLFPHRTVLDNVTLAPRLVKGEGREAAERRAMEMLGVVGLREKAADYPAAISGGQQQRVAIARGMAMEPEVMLYDEPTSALDPERVDEVLDVMEALKAKGITQVVVTHEMAFAREAADLVCFLDGGRIVEQGPPAAVLTRPAEPRTQAFLRRFLATIRHA
jgi:polar amino acid transport system ATP-binding protein